MRRSLALVAALLAVALVGCSSGDPISIEIFYLEGRGFGTEPFRASGVAVDEAVVCENGTMAQDHLESPEGEIITSPEGEIITSEEGAELSDAARVDQGVVDLYFVYEFVCEDGSGTFVLKTHTRGDFAKLENEQDTPTWEVESGTGEYTDLSGSGEVSTDLATVVRTYAGEVQTG